MPSRLRPRRNGAASTTEAPSPSSMKPKTQGTVDPFPTLLEIKAALPRHCFESSLVRSFSYVLRDLIITSTLFLAAKHLCTPMPWLWPLYWFAQGMPVPSLTPSPSPSPLRWPSPFPSQSPSLSPSPSPTVNNRPGTMFWAIFVLGHDCGHGSFSAYSWVNDIVGTILHSFILVPFYSWKLSHRAHHKNTGMFIPCWL